MSEIPTHMIQDWTTLTNAIPGTWTWRWYLYPNGQHVPKHRQREGAFVLQMPLSLQLEVSDKGDQWKWVIMHREATIMYGSSATLDGCIMEISELRRMCEVLASELRHERG